MSQLCLKRLSYGHWHLNENFQYVFWLQRRIPLESTIKRSFRSSESQSWLCLIIACLAIFRKKYVIFQFWTGKAIKQQSASDNLQKSRSGVQTPLCAPCLETPHPPYLLHHQSHPLWLTFSLKKNHAGNDAATISSCCDDDVLCAVVFLTLKPIEYKWRYNWCFSRTKWNTSRFFKQISDLFFASEPAWYWKLMLLIITDNLLRLMEMTEISLN